MGTQIAGDGVARSTPADASSFGVSKWLSVVAVGAFGGLTTALQPLLLGALREAGRIDAASLGRIATVEALSMAVSVTLAGMFLAPRRLRLIAVATLLLGAAANMATGQVSSAAILPLRAVAGAAAGLQLWQLLGLLARIDLPARATGWYVVLQGLTALAVSALFSNVVVPLAGPAGGYAVLAVMALLLLPVTMAMPRQYAAADTVSTVPGFVTRRGLLGLVAAATQMAGIMAFWVYVLPIGKANGFEEGVVRLAVSCAIAAQIVAGIVAIRLATLPPRAVTMACALASLAAVVIVATGADGEMVVAAMAVFGFAWVFAINYHVPLVIELDPTRRSVMLLTGMQLLGAAAGPFVASTMIHASTRWVPVAVSAASLCGVVVLLLLVGRSKA